MRRRLSRHIPPAGERVRNAIGGLFQQRWPYLAGKLNLIVTCVWLPSTPASAA
jgi:hypothetical protein